LKKTTKQKWRKNLDLLSDKQIAKYEDSLEVLSIMRKGITITNASRQVGISVPTVKKYTGSALKLENHRLVAKQNDTLLRKLRIYQKGKEIWITLRGNKQSVIIGQYHSAIGRLEKDEFALKPFKKIKIKDANGKIHRLETDTTKIFAILEKREDSEFYSIYGRR
jgi:hypothetical protein